MSMAELASAAPTSGGVSVLLHITWRHLIRFVAVFLDALLVCAARFVELFFLHADKLASIAIEIISTIVTSYSKVSISLM